MYLTDDKQSTYGKCLRWLNDHLSSCDIQNYIDTPTISIIGSQSTGKSSVLEALSGIAFPRASGTCTRCPTEVRLFNASEEWSCVVTLRIDRDASNQPLEKPSIVKFGPALTKSDEVQERIKAAQRAILNPDKDPLSFIGSKVEADQAPENQISFSENTICLDIRGKELIDLSLVDLPGIIATTGGAEDDQSVDLIKELVKKRISKPGCLILMTITMTDDYQNQIGVKFAQDADPKYQRTLGVLTKPDIVQQDDLSEWTKVVEGKKFPLLHGYYVLKNPSSAQLKKEGYSHKNARDDEKGYFKKEPWHSLNAGTKQRLGSKQLGKQLEKLLEKLIQDKLPQTIETVRKLSAETNEELFHLPKEVPEAAAIQHLHMLLQKLSADVKATLRGDEKPEVFALPLKLLAILFRQKIYKSRPFFQPFTKDEQTMKGIKIKIGDDVEDLFDDEELASDYKAASESKPEDEDGKLNKWIKKGEIYKMQVPQYNLDLSTIQNILNDCALERLPGNISWEIKERMMKKAVKFLPDFSSNLLKDTIGLLKSTVKLVTNQHLDSFSNSLLCGRVTEILLNLIDEEGDKCSMILDAINNCEMEYIYSMNEHYYCDKVKFYCERTLEKRQQELPLSKPDPNSFQGVIQHVQAQAATQKGAENDVDISVSQQIQIASEIRAYWQVAFKRFTDYVRLVIQIKLIKPIGELCLDRLCESMGVYGNITSAKAHALLREADEVRFKRADLQLRKQRLDKASAYIEKFQNGDFEDM
ncbi:uncharacterized protein FA14DRAFT_173905 [Meira miltonrushii]|uniref:P-loop containing nucleoside triphosphate hydrolase protein n=1 Tax=Meira miltonrushii TaxID=1280837 RepID=A0A316VD78_9BASI|nr:uncharacterized protein FA14DRAFT_173905 [Meira miltonrushii]PWN34203.1 hypothetical protein FA14DRAFT_173905 [Meira miltonrushii]